MMHFKKIRTEIEQSNEVEKGVLMLAITEVTVMSSDLMAVKYRSEETE